MTNLHQWAIKHGVSAVALQELQHTLGLLTPPMAPLPPNAAPHTEAYVQSVVRLQASKEGVLCFRNNVGALMDERKRLVRYGLANDSAAMNEVIKSADLIGIHKIIITPQMAGMTIGRFWSRECKAPGWQFTGQGREMAQLAWMNKILSMGGDAAFTTGA